MSTTVTVGPGTGGLGTTTVELVARCQSSIIGQNVITPPSINAPNTPFDSQYTNLTAGSSLLTPPPNATGVIIIPPTTNTATIVMKGAVGDTGIPLNPAAPSMVCGPNAGLSAFVLTVSANINGMTLLFF